MGNDYPSQKPIRLEPNLAAGEAVLTSKQKNKNPKEGKKMAQEKIINGVNVDQLFSTIEVIKGNPKVAQFKFRATNRWIDGTHNRATVKISMALLKKTTRGTH